MIQNISLSDIATRHIKWYVYRTSISANGLLEDFSRTKAFVLVIGKSNRWLVAATVETDGALDFLLPSDLTVGSYSLKAIWSKRVQDIDLEHIVATISGERLCVSESPSCLAVISGSTTSTATITIKTKNATYGYDGLDAYEIAVIRGETADEALWLDAYKGKLAEIQAAEKSVEDVVSTFEEDEAARQETFKQSEASRSSVFQLSEQSRDTAFKQSESERTATFQKNEAARSAAVSSLESSLYIQSKNALMNKVYVSDQEYAIQNEATEVGSGFVRSDWMTLEKDHYLEITKVTPSNAVAGFVVKTGDSTYTTYQQYEFIAESECTVAFLVQVPTGYELSPVLHASTGYYVSKVQESIDAAEEGATRAQAAASAASSASAKAYSAATNADKATKSANEASTAANDAAVAANAAAASVESIKSSFDADLHSDSYDLLPSSLCIDISEKKVVASSSYKLYGPLYLSSGDVLKVTPSTAYSRSILYKCASLLPGIGDELTLAINGGESEYLEYTIESAGYYCWTTYDGDVDHVDINYKNGVLNQAKIAASDAYNAARESLSSSSRFFYSGLILDDESREVIGSTEDIEAVHQAVSTNKKVPCINCSQGDVPIVCSVHASGSSVVFSFEHNGLLYKVTIDAGNNLTTTYFDPETENLSKMNLSDAVNVADYIDSTNVMPSSKKIYYFYADGLNLMCHSRVIYNSISGDVELVVCALHNSSSATGNAYLVFESGSGGWIYKERYNATNVPSYILDNFTEGLNSKVDELGREVSEKQDTLVSGTNIKTINNQSILGSGNITIEGGSGSCKVIELLDSTEESSLYTPDEILNYATNGYVLLCSSNVCGVSTYESSESINLYLLSAGQESGGLFGYAKIINIDGDKKVSIVGRDSLANYTDVSNIKTITDKYFVSGLSVDSYGYISSTSAYANEAFEGMSQGKAMILRNGKTNSSYIITNIESVSSTEIYFSFIRDGVYIKFKLFKQGTYYYFSRQVYINLSNKADKSTTLSGYGITDAYTKTEVDGMIPDDAGDIAYSSETTYSEGTAGAKLANLELEVSEKADAVTISEETATEVASLTPNVLHKWGEVASLTITALATPTDTTIVNEYLVEFVSGETATTLSLPDTITWMGGSAPTISASKTYQISIVNNLAVIGEF